MHVLAIDDVGAAYLIPAGGRAATDVAVEYMRAVLTRNMFGRSTITDAERLLTHVVSDVFLREDAPGITIDVRVAVAGVTVTVTGRRCFTPITILRLPDRSVVGSSSERDEAGLGSQPAWGTRHVGDLTCVWFTLSERADPADTIELDTIQPGTIQPGTIQPDTSDPDRGWRLHHATCCGCGLLIILSEDELDEAMGGTEMLCWNCDHPEQSGLAEAIG